MSDHRPIDPRMPPEAYLYTQGRSGRSVTMTPGPGIRLVREDVAKERIGKLRAALAAIADGRYSDDMSLIEITARQAIDEDDAAVPAPRT